MSEGESGRVRFQLCASLGKDFDRAVLACKAGIMFCCEAVTRAAPASDAVRKVRRFQALEPLVPFVIPEGIPQNEYLSGNRASARFARKGVYRPACIGGLLVFSKMYAQKAIRCIDYFGHPAASAGPGTAQPHCRKDR